LPWDEPDAGASGELPALGFGLEDPQPGEIVFHRLEGCQNPFAVVGDQGVVDCGVLLEDEGQLPESFDIEQVLEAMYGPLVFLLVVPPTPARLARSAWRP